MYWSAWAEARAIAWLTSAGTRREKRCASRASAHCRPRPVLALREPLLERGQREVQQHHEGQAVLEHVFGEVCRRVESGEQTVEGQDRTVIEVAVPAQLEHQLVHVAVEFLQQVLVALEHGVVGCLVAGESACAQRPRRPPHRRPRRARSRRPAGARARSAPAGPRRAVRPAPPRARAACLPARRCRAGGCLGTRPGRYRQAKQHSTEKRSNLVIHSGLQRYAGRIASVPGARIRPAFGPAASSAVPGLGEMDDPAARPACRAAPPAAGCPPGPTAGAAPPRVLRHAGLALLVEPARHGGRAAPQGKCRAPAARSAPRRA
jgi:hypothetical protein